MFDFKMASLCGFHKNSFVYLVLAFVRCCINASLVAYETHSSPCQEDGCDVYESHSPLVKCSYLPMSFLDCKPPEDLKGNDTKKEELGYGCVKFGGQKYEAVEKTRVWCMALPGIECYGNRTFFKDGFPCIRYSGHYFVTTLIYSILLGFIGLDRFCLGHTGTAIGKLVTLGGVGIWWIVDIVLLVTGGLMPEDGSNWQPYV